MSRCLDDQRGSSPVTAVVGVTILLAFLLLASQALLHLYATSTVTAVAFDTARRASVEGGRCPPAPAVRARLGSWGTAGDVEVACSREEDGTTTVSIAGPSPAAALGRFATAFGLGRGGGLEVRRSANALTEPGS